MSGLFSIFGRRFNLERIRRDISSDNQEIRGRAMESLSLEVRKNRAIHQAAAEIFRRALNSELDSWSAMSAARGIEHICGAEEGHRVWLALLNHPNAGLVKYIVLATTDPFYLQPLVELLARRPEIEIHSNALRTLGRMKNAAALPAILQALAVPELRPHAVEALADLGNPEAIAHLQPLLADVSDAWMEDNHGPMLRVCDLARQAIHRLERNQFQ